MSVKEWEKEKRKHCTNEEIVGEHNTSGKKLLLITLIEGLVIHSLVYSM